MASVFQIPPYVLLSMTPFVEFSLSSLLRLKEVCREWNTEGEHLAKMRLLVDAGFAPDESFVRQMTLPLSVLKNRLALIQAFGHLTQTPPTPSREVLFAPPTSSVQFLLAHTLPTALFTSETVYRPAFLSQLINGLYLTTDTAETRRPFWTYQDGTTLSHAITYRRAYHASTDLESEEFNAVMLNADGMIASLHTTPQQLSATVGFINALRTLDKTIKSLESAEEAPRGTDFDIRPTEYACAELSLAFAEDLYHQGYLDDYPDFIHPLINFLKEMCDETGFKCRRRRPLLEQFEELVFHLQWAVVEPNGEPLVTPLPDADE